jgi:hypothetical protein
MDRQDSKMTNENKQALEALDWIEKHSDDPQLSKLKGLYCQLDTIRAALQPKPSVMWRTNLDGEQIFECFDILQIC